MISTFGGSCAAMCSEVLRRMIGAVLLFNSSNLSSKDRQYGQSIFTQCGYENCMWLCDSAINEEAI
jgi:hypothetical protein